MEVFKVVADEATISNDGSQGENCECEDDFEEEHEKTENESDSEASKKGKKKKNSEEITRVTVRMPKKIDELTEKLAKYLHSQELIKKPSKNEAIIYAVMNLGYTIYKQYENHRKGDSQ